MQAAHSLVSGYNKTHANVKYSLTTADIVIMELIDKLAACGPAVSAPAAHLAGRLAAPRPRHFSRCGANLQ